MTIFRSLGGTNEQGLNGTGATCFPHTTFLCFIKFVKRDQVIFVSAHCNVTAGCCMQCPISITSFESHKYTAQTAGYFKGLIVHICPEYVCVSTDYFHSYWYLYLFQKSIFGSTAPDIELKFYRI
jgi:hypothetical protein